MNRRKFLKLVALGLASAPFLKPLQKPSKETNAPTSIVSWAFDCPDREAVISVTDGEYTYYTDLEQGWTRVVAPSSKGVARTLSVRSFT